MKYVVDILCNGVWLQYSKDLIDNSPTVKENFEKQKLVNNSQKLVKDLVKENDVRGKEE